MKKIFVILTVAVIALTTSCNAMLEEKNYGSPTTKDLMTNDENVALLQQGEEPLDQRVDGRARLDHHKDLARFL